jgi:hypothetical protein
MRGIGRVCGWVGIVFCGGVGVNSAPIKQAKQTRQSKNKAPPTRKRHKAGKHIQPQSRYNQNGNRNDATTAELLQFEQLYIIYN